MKSFLIALPSGDKIPLDKASTSLGRSRDNDIVAKIKYISNRHCRIFREGYRYFIEDLSSSNGTFVNGERIQGIVELRDNDTVTLSPQGSVYQFCSPRSSALWASVLRARVWWTGFLRSVPPRFLRSVFEKQHLPVTLSIGVAVVLLVLSGFLFFPAYGKVDVTGDLAEMRRVYGMTNIPEDPAFSQAVARYVEAIRNTRGMYLILNRKEKYSEIVEPILTEMRIPQYFYFIPSRFTPITVYAALFRILPSLLTL